MCIIMYFIHSINIISEVNTLWLVKNQRLTYTSTSTLKTCKELLIKEQIRSVRLVFLDIFKTTNNLNKKITIICINFGKGADNIIFIATRVERIIVELHFIRKLTYIDPILSEKYNK